VSKEKNKTCGYRQWE